NQDRRGLADYPSLRQVPSGSGAASPADTGVTRRRGGSPARPLPPIRCPGEALVHRRREPMATPEPLSTGAPLTLLNDDEEMFRDAVRQFARDVVAPKRRAIDETQQMDAAPIPGLS